MLKTGIFPSQLKIAKVMPLHKKNNKNLFENYRPISILPSISKVFERVIYNQLYEYFDINKLFFSHQYGFRKLHSTELAALELSDLITNYLDKNETPFCIFLDYSKAFDTINHTILLDKLQYYGIQNLALNLLRNYLSNRKQYVQYKNTSSDLLPITTGVPQGSILGPLLFIIYINDFNLSTKSFHPIMYADDTTLLSTLSKFESDKHLNSELNKILNWLKVNKLSLNKDKTKFMVFSTTSKNIYKPDLRIDVNTKIEQVDSFNFLGIHMDNNMKWNSHINNISCKLLKTIGILNKLNKILPVSTLINIYNSLVLSTINYGQLTWGYHATRVSQLQKRIIRIISSSPFNAHTEPIFKNLKLLKFEDILFINELKKNSQVSQPLTSKLLPKFLYLCKGDTYT